MDARILDAQCTLYQKGAEVDRVATWTLATFPCHWEQRTGSYRTPDGEDSAYALDVICKHPGIGKGDKLAYGVQTSPEPPQSAYTVVYVDTLPFRGKVHHYEVYAK